MPQTSKTKPAKKRVKVESLPGQKKKVSTKEAKKVQGGRPKMFALVDRTNLSGN
ncbi:MAG TPA: hypothetical protein VMS31_07700 [Pyrinomonadaceae bacterium]|nr:hypothetical protein [Pyrinomonadaceae bacterium]